MHLHFLFFACAYSRQTHIDIVEDFDQDLITCLQELSQEHNFLLFEDRKFADIGNNEYPHFSS